MYLVTDLAPAELDGDEILVNPPDPPAFDMYIPPIPSSTKFDTLVAAIKAMISNNGRDVSQGETAARPVKAVVFCTFVRALQLFQDALAKEKILAGMLHGRLSMTQRWDVIHAFSSATGPPVLLCSTKCAGVGLNLVAGS